MKPLYDFLYLRFVRLEYNLNLYGVFVFSPVSATSGSWKLWNIHNSALTHHKTGDKNNLWCVAWNTSKRKYQSYFVEKPAGASLLQVIKLWLILKMYHLDMGVIKGKLSTYILSCLLSNGWKDKSICAPILASLKLQPE